jgi:hypothetical protein
LSFNTSEVMARPAAALAVTSAAGVSALVK